MHLIILEEENDFEGWRSACKIALQQGVNPDELSFQIGHNQLNLLSGAADEIRASVNVGDAKLSKPPAVPASFITLAQQVTCHRNSERFSLLYQILFRIQREKNLLSKVTDKDVFRANQLAKEVHRDMHKMKAFVRFRKVGVDNDGREQFVAWFEPSNHIVKLTAPFFMRRFAGMNWSILTPEQCAHWDGETLLFSGGLPKSAAPHDDTLEDYWRTYYASIFNPARLKINAMTSEMPKKYWKNLPEAQLIPDLIKKSNARENEMINAAPTLPNVSMMAHREVASSSHGSVAEMVSTISQVNVAVRNCRACPLWESSTQAVCGVGPTNADIMLVGEQPGDLEDLQGRPFVGPAGQLLHTLLHEVGIHTPYITNAVKHFKFEPRGKRRIHKRPSASEIDHCKWWLQKEVSIVQPKVIIALGLSAARALIGKTTTISEMRNNEYKLKDNIRLFVTRHPSSILRLPDELNRLVARDELRFDLEKAFASFNDNAGQKNIKSAEGR